MRVITTNKKANFEYFVLQKFTAGIVLQGGEVKSVRAGHISINDTYVIIKKGEAYIINSYRSIFYEGKMPNFEYLGIALLFGVVFCFIGYFIFKKLEKRFAEEL